MEEFSADRRLATEKRHREREQDIIAATRELLDTRGVQNTQIEHIAHAVGINKAILYRHFNGKDELFALALCGYLEELRDRFTRAVEGADRPAAKLQALVEEFVGFGSDHPAFIDASRELMLRPGGELIAEVGESTAIRFGSAAASSLGILTRVLAEGAETGDFEVADPVLLANMLYASGLGMMQLARLGVLISESAPGVPSIAPVTRDQVRDHLIASALANVGVRRSS
ncbi:MAG: TetR/AcrR family transcriptional regulator [Nocardioidaceae bacterium]